MSDACFDLAAHRRRILDALRKVPDVHDAEALERLGQASMRDDLFCGGGGGRP